MNQADILRRGEARRNTEPEHQPLRVICADATGCEYAQDGDCPFAEVHRRTDVNDVFDCPETGKPTNWREV